MDIKEYLEKLNNKVAENLKRLTATALVTGTILTGAGMTACEKDGFSNMTNAELASQISEELQKQIKDFELGQVTFAFIDNIYFMTVFNNDFSEYRGYEISKSQYDNLFKLASETDSEYVEISPYGDVFVIEKRGIMDESLREFNEVICSTISNGKTIDVSKYVNIEEVTPNLPTDIDSDDRSVIELGLKYSIEGQDIEHVFDNFKPDYICIYPQKELKKQFGNNSSISMGVQDCFEFVDVYSQEGNEEFDSKKVATFITIGEFKMDEFISLLESKVDNEKIRAIENGFLVDTSIFDEKNMSDLNAYFKQLVFENGAFLYDFSYEAPLQEGEFSQEDSVQER